MMKVLNVAYREFVTTVFSRGFAIAVFLPPLMISIMLTVMPLLMRNAAPKVSGKVAVIDRSGKIAPYLPAKFAPEDALDKAVEEAKKNGIPTDSKQLEMAKAITKVPESDVRLEVLDSKADSAEAKKPILSVDGKNVTADGNARLALLVIPAEAMSPSAPADSARVELFHAPKLDSEWIQQIERATRKAIVDARLEADGISIAKVREDYKTPDVVPSAVTATGDVKTSEVTKLLLPGAFMFLLWMSVFTSGQYLLTSLIEEKSSRVTEVILSAVSPLQLLIGKIMGQCGVGLLILGSYGTTGMMALTYYALSHEIAASNIVFLFIYFFIAFTSIACLFGAVGSAVSDVREAQSLIGPVMIVLMIPMLLWMPILRNPNSMFAQVMSFIPPLSPFVMVLRLAGSEPVPVWQVVGSIVLGIVSVMFFAWAAAKIFRIGVLLYGKPPNFVTLIKWVRMA